MQSTWRLRSQNMLPVEPPTLSYVALGLATVFALPAFGRGVLAFLRDLDDYRANRHRR
jgi:hypothetical protein